MADTNFMPDRLTFQLLYPKSRRLHSQFLYSYDNPALDQVIQTAKIFSGLAGKFNNHSPISRLT